MVESKRLNIKIIPCAVVVGVFFTSTVYGIDLSDRRGLRLPLLCSKEKAFSGGLKSGDR